MFPIERCQLPDDALLKKYADSEAYTDCYRTELKSRITHSQYVEAFYTTWLFKLERIVLKWWLSKPSSDSDAKKLAGDQTDVFAAWHVEERSENQLLLSDFQGRTRSWLMVAPMDNDGRRKTRLFFGSAVVPNKNKETKKNSFPPGFFILLAFHKIYSKLLLYSARTSLNKELYR